MRLLILGGTRFLGRHLAQQALAAGHELTLLHRGRSAADLFPEAEHLIADRDREGEFDAALNGALAGGAWDAVVDTSAYLPRQVRSAAAALAGRVGQYQLVSTISVYAGFDAAVTTEDASLQVLPDPKVQVVDGSTYGGLKALCEAAAYEGFEDACLVSRPGLLVGPFDPTGRFTWWVQRFVRADSGDDDETEVLAPGDPATPVQFIDARDAAAWMLHQAEAGHRGTCNLTGPENPATMGELLATARDTLAPTSELLWVDEAFLLEQGVAPWSDLPVWLPLAQSGVHRVDITRALDTGLQCRPWAQTLRDTAAWAATATPPAPGGPLRPPVGLAPEREANLRAAWRAR
ncbi:MAG: NAD-dependent epimerase/dehydratase family protein [Betaproteobacteria bacterium]|nr:NAD-dependent epimerase/dehydratase family protein [Betaproteobacteria bacterium]